MQIFYDGNCPLCFTTMQKYKTLIRKKKSKKSLNIQFINFRSPSFDFSSPLIAPKAIEKAIHVRTEEGLYIGIDGVIQIWKIIDAFPYSLLSKLSSFLLFYKLLSLFYSIFAKLRYLLPKNKKLCQEDSQCGQW